jgi:hypothetical protein
MKSGTSSSNWGNNHSDSMSRYVHPVTVVSEKKKGPNTAVGYGAEKVYLPRMSFMLQCGTRVFPTPKSQIIPIDFAT